MLEKRSLSTKSATPSSRVLLSAYATPTAFVLTAVLPGAAGVLAILMAMTIGAETMSVFTNKRSSTADRLPGEACLAFERSQELDNAYRTYLLVQDELGGLLPLSCLRDPYFHFELLTGQGIPQEALRQTLAERNAR